MAGMVGAQWALCRFSYAITVALVFFTAVSETSALGPDFQNFLRKS